VRVGFNKWPDELSAAILWHSRNLSPGRGMAVPGYCRLRARGRKPRPGPTWRTRLSRSAPP